MEFEHTEVMNFEGAFRGMRNPMNSWAKSDSMFYVQCDMDEDYFDDSVYTIGEDYCKNITDISDEEYGNIVQLAQDYLFAQKSRYAKWGEHSEVCNVIGPNDMDLAKRLIAGGGEHRKFLRQIFVSVDITAPLYWWKEFDTYKVGTTANSTSTMHKLASTPITKDCFEMGDYCGDLPVGMYALAGCEEYLEEPDYSQPIECGKLTIYDTETGETTEDIHYSNASSREDSLYNECFNGVIHLCERLRQLYLETKDKRYWKELIRILPNGWLQTRTVTMNYENLRNMYHQRKGHKLIEWHSFCEWVESLPYAKELIID